MTFAPRGSIGARLRLSRLVPPSPTAGAGTAA
jgi:hypothetical protein